MQITNRSKIVLSTLAVCAAATGVVGAVEPLSAAPADNGTPSPAKNGKQSASASAKKGAAPTRALTEDEKIVHVLNRFGFGPRPGDVEKVKAMGLKQYIALQLTPEKIDDSAVDKQLAAFTQLQMSDEQIDAMYHDFLAAERATRA